jgi:acylphosphatase
MADCDEPRPDPGAPRPDPGAPRPDPGEPRPDPGEPWPDPGEPWPDSAEPLAESAQSLPDPAEPVRLTAWVRGWVQGVGFRWWVRSRALALRLAGFVENLADGRVKVVAEGPRDACQQLLDLLSGSDTPGRVAQVTYRWDAPRGGLAGFAER